MKIFKSKKLLRPEVAQFINDNQIPREDIFSIVADGAVIGSFTLFYYEEPKPEEEKKGFWG